MLQRSKNSTLALLFACESHTIKNRGEFNFMVRSARSVPIIVPNVTSLFGDDRTAELFPETKKWAHGVFSHDGMSAPYYASPASNEKAIAIGCTGLNTHYLLLPDEVKRLNAEGISLVWMAIPPVKHAAGFLNKYTELAREFFTNPKSPAHVFFPNDVPRYAATHSTSGQIFLKLLHDESTREKLTRIFSGVAYMAPYLDSANASLNHSTIGKRFFHYYANLALEKTPHEARIARWFLKYAASREDFAQHGQKISPTFGQILEVQQAGRTLLQNFNAAAANVLPSVFILGNKDPFACYKTAHTVASLMGAEKIIAKGGGHHPLLGHPEAMDSLIEKINACATRHRHQRENTVYIQPTAPEQQRTDNVVPLPQIHFRTV